MNRDNIIRMSREAGWSQKDIDSLLCIVEAVAAAEQKAVLETIEELMGAERDRNPMFSDGYDYALGHIEQFVKGRKA